MIKKQCFKRFLMLLVMLSLVIGTSSVMPSEMSTVSYASTITETENEYFDEVYEKFDAAYNIDDAHEVITKALFKDFTDENIYDLMSLTYAKEKWTESIDHYTVYKLRILIVEKGNWINRYYKKILIDPNSRVPEYKLEVIWPPDNGFKNNIHDAVVLTPGTVIDRYGYPGGHFLSPVGVPYKERAVAPGTKETRPYYQYKVLKAFPIAAGPIAPWFGVEGEGQQYYMPLLSIQDYIDLGFLEKVEV